MAAAGWEPKKPSEVCGSRGRLSSHPPPSQDTECPACLLAGVWREYPILLAIKQGTAPSRDPAQWPRGGHSCTQPGADKDSISMKTLCRELLDCLAPLGEENEVRSPDRPQQRKPRGGRGAQSHLLLLDCGGGGGVPAHI
jgi:hypothetical protein